MIAELESVFSQYAMVGIAAFILIAGSLLSRFKDLLW